MRVDNAIIYYLRNKLDTITNELLLYQRASMPADQLYRALIPDERTYHVLCAAAELVQPGIWYAYRDMVIDTPNQVKLCNFLIDLPQGHWLLPEKLAVLTPESELGKLLLPTIDVAHALANLKFVFEQVTSFMPYSNVLPVVFPWVKDLVRDVATGLSNEDKRYTFCRNELGMGYSEKGAERLLKVIKAIELGQGTHNMPSLTKEISEVCRAGAQLITQFRMLKGAKVKLTPGGYGSMTPSIKDASIQPHIRKQMELIRQSYGQEYWGD